MRKLLILLLTIPFFSSALAQRNYGKQYWSTNIMLSSATFLSDLGGKDWYGTNDPQDIDLKDIRYAFGAEFEYHGAKGFGFLINGFYTRLSADDAETTWDRSLRMLHVRTDVFETSVKFQYTVPYKVQGLGGFYVNAGGGVHFFKPMAEWNGIWYDLRPLGTEGQVADPNRSPYKKFSPVIPFSFGKKFRLGNGMTLSADISLRKSFTDYLDDVSGNYYDTAIIFNSTGLVAAHFADPSNNDGGVGRIGYERGNPLNVDNYFLFGLKLEIPLSQGGRYANYNTSCSFQNSWINKNGSTPKFKRRGKTRNRLFR
jgi:hypothetical protein